MSDEFTDNLRAAIENHIASVTADPNWAERPKRKGVNPSSAVYWLPRITKELPTWIPRSEVVPYDHHKAVCQMEGESPYTEWPQVLARVGEAARAIGYPVFIRTDLASAKHGGPSDYLARNEAELPRVLFRTMI